ncbi:MAG: SsrA-binding protein SmpB [Erysipelotrichaceae bacterium]|jgi:SsrA-binding protein|nr:SsrA-binding protein SmpB [Erysipelotrichaceae bacterium]MBR2808712.1 SsrA-binding protein SmpB [Erysipelotrichaceae bacterium]
MSNIKEVAVNRKAYHDYFIIEEYEAGIVLIGPEIKSIRAGKVQIKDSYVSFVNHEAILKGMNIAKFKEANIFNHDEERERKLLLNKREIYRLEEKVKLEGLTIIPLKVILKDGLCKIEIALCKGKTNYDKRESDRKRTMEMEARQALRH